MPSSFETLQGWIALALGLAAVGLQVYALVEAVRHRAAAYPAAGKLTKPVWCAILAVALALGLLSVRNPLNIFEIAAVVAAAVFLADVRPALRQVLGRTRSGGPYGGW